MAWNRSTETAKPVQKASKKTPVGVFIALGLCLVALAAWWFLRPSDKPETADKDVKPTRIKEVKPAAAPKAEEAPQKVEKPKHEVGKFWYTDDGKKMITLVKNGATNDVEVYVPKNRKVPRTRIFEHRSENQIANLLRLEPGTGVFGNQDYKGFKEDFLKSCEVPIVASQDDDEWTAQLKKDVTAAKIDLRNRLADGEDIEQVMRDTREEYKKLAAIKNMIEKEVLHTLINEDVTADQMAAIREAANKMLEEKGIPPLKSNPFVEQRILEMKKGAKK